MARASNRQGIDLVLHRVFEGSLLAKAALAFLEFASGIALYFVNGPWVVGLVERVTTHEITHRPHDRVAAAILREADAASPEVQTFYAYYLAGHGLIKLALVAGLWRGALWSYPASLVALTLFVLYQMHLYLASGSVVMLALTVFDLLVMALVWREWHRVTAAPA
jgi:uncharacterized membrane protein